MKIPSRPALLAAALLCNAPAAVACEFHGPGGHGFHPFGLWGSMPNPAWSSNSQTTDAASKVTAAKPAEPVAPSVDAKTLERIGPHLRTLYYMLDGLAMAGNPAPVSVLSQESGQWIRFAREGKVMQVLVDTKEPAAGDLVIRASVAKLGEVFERRVKLPAAVESGTVVIEAGSKEADAVRRILMLSFS
ncbi:MAG: hypothetical protein JNM76_07515 [Betaproteobacteria bacterium]|nr:hypothetical protein [Betaproteobacteria bacterium]